MPLAVTMSVYTSVSNKEVEAFLGGYSIGNLKTLRGIENGITNTNYWLSSEDREYVLTLYEQHEPQALDYILGLQQHLGDRDVACSRPVIDNQGRLYSILKGKPAAIIHRVAGEVATELSQCQCQLIGKEMAKFHLAGQTFPFSRNNPCGHYWRIALQEKLLPLLTDLEQKLLDEELTAYQAITDIDLPSGATHSDLFHDNCLFNGDILSGIIDFDYACNESFIYDISISLNDCCIKQDGRLDETLSGSFLGGYQAIRPLLDVELDQLGLMLRLAATRFWLSRLHDRHFPLAGEMTFTKDPDVFKNILLLRR
ncbi:MAG: homoserine kinase [Gammaproteobacteria bacterium]|nr:homoserine kinase [Gammaproteobacteria bacterium]